MQTEFEMTSALKPSFICLFRYCEQQWKERGLGEIKILWKEETGQARVVMRREQVGNSKISIPRNSGPMVLHKCLASATLHTL